MTPGDPAWPATLVEFVAVVSAELVRLHVTADTAEEHARRIVAALAHHCGGRPVYLPRGERLRTAIKHDAIYRAANGTNTDELAREHGMTTRAIQRIVADQAKLHRARRAPEVTP